MSLSHSIGYPFRGEGALTRLALLGLVQLVPLVGQWILIGYGVDTARHAANHLPPPPIHWGHSLRQGARIFGIGLVMALPVILMLLVVITVGTSPADGPSTSSGVPLPLLTLAATVGLVFLLRFLRKRGVNLRMIAPVLVLAVPLVSIMISFASIRTILSDPTPRVLNPLGLAILIIGALLLALIALAVQIGAVRQALIFRGLLDPTGTLKLLAAQRGNAVRLVVGLFVLNAIGAVVTALGFVLLIVPGLVAFAGFSLAGWALVSQFVAAADLLPDHQTTQAPTARRSAVAAA